MENGYCESFNGKLRNELLNGEIFYTLREAQVLIEQWRHHYNRVRPHRPRLRSISAFLKAEHVLNSSVERSRD